MSGRKFHLFETLYFVKVGDGARLCLALNRASRHSLHIYATQFGIVQNIVFNLDRLL